MRPDALARHVALDRRPAGDAVAPWVENHWRLAWDLPPGRSYASEVLPHPTCSLTLEVATHPREGMPPGDRVVVTGVCTRRFDVDVRGSGLVLGVRFRPGGLAALTGADASTWSDRTVPARSVLPAPLVDRLADPDLARDPAAWEAAVEAGLAALDPGPDERYDEVLAVVATMLADPALLTVGEVAQRHGCSPRRLQRLFARYVGVGPKWVLARYRMHDVVAALDAGYDGTLTDLAVHHGWYDQAHFTRDFTALVGVTPGRYRDARG
ncbi:helix-turn-helix transcriptional regulator [Arthrobacter sp. NEB 688]|nr:helix-turn-helix transcriptional regulator [Arthrobacter sp. NEB 688]